jgi:hypothetical protein
MYYQSNTTRKGKGKKEIKKTNLVVPSKSGGCSAVASNGGANFSGTLLSKLPIWKTKGNLENSLKQQAAS